MNRTLSHCISGLVLIGAFATPSLSRMMYEPKDRIESKGTEDPLPYCMAAHRAGKIVLGVTNNGAFGTNYAKASNVDCFTQQQVPSCQYPKFTQVEYLYGAAFWIGAVLGRDTVVSVGHDGWSANQEFEPLPAPEGTLTKRSLVDPTNSEEYEGAISEEDFICTFSDTVLAGKGNDYFGRPHKPLDIEVHQRSFAWSYAYAEDFVLFDFAVKNAGIQKLTKVYMGVYVDADVSGVGNDQGFSDDLCGFVEAFYNEFRGCRYLDTVNLAWIADNDGDPIASEYAPSPAVTATRIIRTPNKTLDVSFNWWIGNGNPDLDFGPREQPEKGRLKEEFRDYRTGGLGTPEGDVNKYYALRNREFDYDQAFTGKINASDTLWMLPNPELAANYADGYDTRYLLSFGPFDIAPGEVLPISLAYVAGEDFHTVRGNLANLPENPELYYANLGFEDLANNGRWASWIYDNPGVDTDGDGFRGDYVICVDSMIYDTGGVIDTIIADTVYIRGDGVPDFRGASPPPAPQFRVSIEPRKLIVRWNGLRSETTKDDFAGIIDFEGYRVYMGRSKEASNLSVVNSYDIEDFNKYVYLSNANNYVLIDLPFSRAQLKALYGSNFEPEDYNRNNPFELPLFPDSLFYFAPQDYNHSVLTDPTTIHKIYPNQAYPSSIIPDSADPDELTPEGNLKYFEYEYVKDSLQISYPYYVNVTAFDFGSPASGLPSLETPITTGAVVAYAWDNADSVAAKDLKVYVYPNPYRSDGGYLEHGYETAVQNRKDLSRRVHFANVPPKCKIRIFTLDGDL
ncbi:MAG: hypothetical protein AAB305_03900, partial [Candidatus Zixiibacteriota bacterium]